MTISETQMNIGIPIVLATRNEGKVSEIRTLLEGTSVMVKSLNDFGPIPPVVEDGETFEGNAVKKAQFTARVLGFPALADDSGLVVKAMDGQPGVHSARFAGEDASDKDNNLKLLKAMDGVEDREAFFMCILAIAVPSGPALIYEATCHGIVTETLIGDQGFGYDPLFYYPPLEKTFAQMSTEEKNAVSHRGKALTEFKGEIAKVLIWLRQRLAEERSRRP